MNKDQILDNIIKSNIIEKVANSLISRLKYNKKDFIQEIYLMILLIPEDKLIKLYNDNLIYFYIVKIALNQALCKKSVFNKKYTNDKLIYLEYIENLNITDE